MATYKDIQRATGLSLSTISKHFNGGNVHAANRQAIETAAAELGFRVNRFARSLRGGRSNTVGVLLPALDNNFHLTIIAGVERALRADGISLLVAASPQNATADAVELLLDEMVDGIIAVPSAHDFAPLQRAIAVGVPVIAVDWAGEGFTGDTVVLDNRGAGAAAARHLLDHGHRHIAMIGGPADIPTVRERGEGFVSETASRDSGHRADLVQGGSLTTDAGRRAMREILDSPTRPTGVFCANYELTVGALEALNESGLRIPGDISFVGFDTRELAMVTRPRLTGVVQPVEALARTAATLMSRRLGPGGSSLERTVSVHSGDLVVGASVSDPRDTH